MRSAVSLQFASDVAVLARYRASPLRNHCRPTAGAWTETVGCLHNATPHRSYRSPAVGLQWFAVETHDSGEYRYVRGKLQRNRERITVRGLSDNHNKDLKNLSKVLRSLPARLALHEFYIGLVTKGCDRRWPPHPGTKIATSL